ncbi:MAG: peptide-methionine (R)-S-oxide reductase MsrB [Pseudomonadota bacterium]|nr:peptide-methionine (R)-S-oxide reductase MsrB [Pseudomonadota bacterium]
MNKISKNKFMSNLSLLQYKVTQEGATEPPFSHKGFEKGAKVFVCVCCGSKLFKIENKFESGSGWPSFSSPYSSEVVTEHRDDSYGMIRTEVKCRKCNAHLGHVFEDGPEPTGLRYCINGVAIDGKK